MKDARRQKQGTPAAEDTPVVKKSFVKSEWPLFLYPALVFAALGMLYAVNRSIQRAPVLPEPAHETKAEPTQTVNEEEPRPEPRPEPRLVPQTPNTRLAIDDRAGRHNRMALPHGPSLEPSQKATGLLSQLDKAVQTEDHATIKQCMRDIVALGDEAVESLAEMIANGDDETAIWAAEALARIGTPVATSMLLETLAQTEEGPYREALAKQVSSVADHDSWPVLMDTFLESTDATVQRAASASLAAMADTAIVDEIVAMYDAATTEEQAAQLAQLIANISSPKASDSLLALAGNITSTPQDSLQEATIAALANIGDAQCVSYLLRKLEAASPGQSSSLFAAITQINQPQAQAALLYAAAGNKEVSAGQGRTAAIYALQNYPNGDTYALLQQIAATEDNTAVVTAALRTLEQIEESTPALAETATSKAEPVADFSTHPLQK